MQSRTRRGFTFVGVPTKTRVEKATLDPMHDSVVTKNVPRYLIVFVFRRLDGSMNQTKIDCGCLLFVVVSDENQRPSAE